VQQAIDLLPHAAAAPKGHLPRVLVQKLTGPAKVLGPGAAVMAVAALRDKTTVAEGTP